MVKSMCSATLNPKFSEIKKDDFTVGSSTDKFHGSGMLAPGRVRYHVNLSVLASLNNMFRICFIRMHVATIANEVKLLIP